MEGLHGEVSKCLLAIEQGDDDAVDRLLPFIYEDLRRIAAGLFVQQRPDQTLQPTALVHEAYLRLVGNSGSFEGRRHFFNVAARAMRQILADYGRRRTAQKRGGAGDKVALVAEEIGGGENQELRLGELDDALRELEEIEPRQARIFERRYLSGMSVDDIAASLGMAPRTVRLDCQMARAWIRRRLDASD